MKMYIKTLQTNILNNIKENPHEVFVGLGVFFTVLMGTSVQHVASSVFLLLFLASFFVVKKWGEVWRILSKTEKWFLIGLALYAASGVVAYINVQDTDEYIKVLERYFRFLLMIPMYLYIRYYKINVIRYLYAGAIVSGPFLLYVALNSYLKHPEVPAQGYYHHIIFGSLAMLNVGVMLTLLMTVKLKMLAKVLLIISMLCGLVTVSLSQARGVWLVLPAYSLIIIFYTLKYSKVKLLASIMAGSLVAGGMLFAMQGDMVNKRISLAVDEVSSYYSDNQYKSSLGTRLAMWDIAVDVWKKHPVIGTGPGDFDEDVRARQKLGEFKGMNVFASTHNIYFQAIVNAGVIGMLTMVFALFYAPYKVISVFAESEQTKYILGMTFLLAFAIIGISESWTLRLPIISVYIVYVLVVLSSLFVTKKIIK